MCTDIVFTVKTYAQGGREGDGSRRAVLKLLVRVLDQLHVLLVPLLDVLQQHLGLVSLQLQGLHLRRKGAGQEGRGGWGNAQS